MLCLGMGFEAVVRVKSNASQSRSGFRDSDKDISSSNPFSSSYWLSLNPIAARNVPFSFSDLPLGGLLVQRTSIITDHSPGRTFHLPLCILIPPPLPQRKPISKLGGIILPSIKKQRRKPNLGIQVCHSWWLFSVFEARHVCSSR